MGYGDKLMAIGDAWAQHQQDPLKRRVAIGTGENVDTTDLNLAFGLDSFLAPPALAGEDVTWVRSFPGHRPYIDYDAMRQELEARGVHIHKPKKLVARLGRYIWRADYRPTPAPIVLTPHEQQIIEQWSRRGPFAIVEPNTKRSAPPAKQWGVGRFYETGRQLATTLPVYQFVQPGSAPLTGLLPIYTSSFRDVFPYLKAASLYVGPEGGLHHAAAAMGTPAVVVYGGFISPAITGYPDIHINLTGGASHYCGTRYLDCPHCRVLMNNITPSDVLNESRRLLEASHGR